MVASNEIAGLLKHKEVVQSQQGIKAIPQPPLEESVRHFREDISNMHGFDTRNILAPTIGLDGVLRGYNPNAPDGAGPTPIYARYSNS